MTLDTKHSDSADQLLHPRYRADIDGLRAVAVLAVVGFHAFPGWIKGGFVGVDVFFVISGFLISSIIISNLERNTFSFREFYGRRIRRIFPALLLVLVCSYAFGWRHLLPLEYKQLGKHIAAGAAFVSNFALWNESGYFDNAAETKPLLHLWSLGIEEQFYIVWPLLLWLGWKRRASLPAIVVSIALLSFLLNILEVRADGTAAFYSPQTRFWELLIGSALAYVTLREKTPLTGPASNLRNGTSLVGAAIVAAGILLTTREKSFPGWWALLPTVGVALIIYSGSHAWLNRRVLSNRVLVWFGWISFPLYLWHWPLLTFARLVEHRWLSADLRLLAVATSILLAWLTYKLVEKPIRFGRHGNKSAVVLALAMMVVGFVGYNSYERDGLGFRFPQVLRDIVQYKYQRGEVWGKNFCFLSPKDDYTAFDACDSPPKGEKRPTLLLWGDSHAAHLYPGYQTVLGDKFSVIARTASSCPPILNLDPPDLPNCKQINDHVFEYIKKEKPDRIVLQAAWDARNLQRLEDTISELRKYVNPDIDLVGPVPEWKDGLPRQLFLYYQSNRLRHVPERMKFGLNPEFFKVDELLSRMSAKIHVNYISPVRVLCNGDGCITRLGDTGETLTAFDSAHLTDVGSVFLVSHFPGL